MLVVHHYAVPEALFAAAIDAVLLSRSPIPRVRLIHRQRFLNS